MRLRIEPTHSPLTPGPRLGAKFRVLLGEFDITSWLRSLHLHIPVDGVVTADLGILVSNLDIDTEVLAALHAYLELQEQKRGDVPGAVITEDDLAAAVERCIKRTMRRNGVS